MRDQCPHCGRYLVRANGPANSDLLLVGEFPGEEEINIGLPFVGRAGGVLSFELALAGITLQRCRVTNLWLHDKTKNNTPCFNLGMSALLQELSTPRKAVLFMGSELPSLFGLPNVTSISGLILDGIPVLDLPYPCIFMPNPATVFHGPLGEVRFGIGQFGKLVKETRNVRATQ